MAITSPFKKLAHSREGSHEEHHHRQPSSGSVGQVRRAAKGQLSKSSTMRSDASTVSANTAALAQQFESDKQRLVKYCFSSYDADGILVDSYITHVRVIEDAAYPSDKPPAHSPSSNKKPRILVLAVKKDGTVYLNKGRENSNGSFQIGRTWSLDELTALKRETSSDLGFTATLGKNYYWETSTTKERQVFVTSLIRIYRKFKHGFVPELINWDLKIFGLDDELYKSFVNKENVLGSPKNIAASSPRASDQSSPKKGRLNQQNIPPLMATPVLPISRSATVLPKDQYARTQSSDPAQLHQQPKLRSASIDGPPKADISPQASRSQSPSIEVASPEIRAQHEVPNVQQKSQSKARTPLPSQEVVAPLQPRRQSENSGKTLRPAPVVGAVTAASAAAVGGAMGIKLSGVAVAGGPPSTSKQRIADELDIPRRLDSVQTDATTSSLSNKLERLSTHGSQSAESKDTVNSFENKRPVAQLGEDESDSDDITDLYAADSDPEPIAEPVPFPTELAPATSIVVSPAEDGINFSFHSSDASFDQTNASHELLNTTPKAVLPVTPSTIEAQTHSDDEYDDLNQTTDELQIRAVRGRRRAGTVNSIVEQPDNEQASFDDIFDEIPWESNDDAETMTAKLMKELAETEYEIAKSLIELRGNSSHLNQQTKKIGEECHKLTPLFNVFAVELSGFVKDIKDIETEGQGLQLETINKKNLYGDLKNLLQTVSVDDSSLNILLRGDIDNDIDRLESTLADLESALDAIRGGDKDEDDLSDMYALRERRSKYEAATTQFLKRVKVELDSRFKYIIGEILKYECVNDITFKDVLSEMLVYSGLTLFVRNASDDHYSEMVSSWETFANPFYRTVLSSLGDKLLDGAYHKNKVTLTSDGYTPGSGTASMRTRSSTLQSTQHDRLREKFGMMDSSSANSIPRYSNDQNSELETIITTFQSLQKHVIFQQDFIVKFFHMNTEDVELSSYISNHPIADRPALLTSLISEIDSDRANARDIYNVLSSIFQPSLEAMLKTTVQCLRSNQRNTPAFLVYLELFEKQFGSSNQEFLLSAFKKLSNRLKSDWERFVDVEVKGIEKYMMSKVKREGVSTVVKNFCMLITGIETEIGKVVEDNHGQLESRELVEQSYVELCSSVLRNLNADSHDQTLSKVQENGNFEHHHAFLTNNIQNTNWVIQSLSPLKLERLDQSLVKFNAAFNASKNAYVKFMVQEHFGKLESFVQDVVMLSKEFGTKDPSKRVSYSKEEISKLLSQYTLQEITKTIASMRQAVKRQFHDEEMSEIQRGLVDKLWSALQTEFVSITLRLSDILSQYYRDVEMTFSKRDVIAAFSAARS